jgi:HEPN domain-containing protein
MEAWGHVVHQLLGRLRPDVDVPDEHLDFARQLDRHYMPTRYPNGFDSGAPGDFYTEEDSRRAIEQAEVLIELCSRQVA